MGAELRDQCLYRQRSSHVPPPTRPRKDGAVVLLHVVMRKEGAHQPFETYALLTLRTRPGAIVLQNAAQRHALGRARQFGHFPTQHGPYPEPPGSSKVGPRYREAETAAECAPDRGNLAASLGSSFAPVAIPTHWICLIFSAPIICVSRTQDSVAVSAVQRWEVSGVSAPGIRPSPAEPGLFRLVGQIGAAPCHQIQRLARGKVMASKGATDTSAFSAREAMRSHCPSCSRNASSVRASGSTSQSHETPSRA